MALNKKILSDLGAEPVEPEEDIYAELGAEPMDDAAATEAVPDDVAKIAADLGAEPVEDPDLGEAVKEGVKSAIPGYKFFEDILEGFKKTKAQQDALAQQQAQDAAAQQQAQAEKDADPATWSSTRFQKEAPKPRTMEEKALYDAILAQKKEREGILKDGLLGGPEARISATPEKKGFPALVESLKKFYRPSGSEPAQVAKAQIIRELAAEYDLPSKEVEANFDELARRKAQETGVYTQPTNEEFLNAIMVGSLPMTVAIAGPLSVAKGLASYTAIKEGAERIIFPAAKAVAQAVSSEPVKYEVTKFREMFPDVGPVRDIADLSEFVLYGLGAKSLIGESTPGKESGLTKVFRDNGITEPRILGELGGLRYRILKALGVKQPTELVPLTDAQIREAFGDKAWKYLSKEGLAEWKSTELGKRMATESGTKAGEGTVEVKLKPGTNPVEVPAEVLKDLGAEAVVETPVPVKLPKNKKLVAFTDPDKEILGSILQDVQEMEAKRRLPIENARGEEETIVTGYVPEYLSNIGVTKAKDGALLERAIKGDEGLTAKQHERILDLMDRWIQEQETRYGKSIEELRSELPQSEAEEALRLADQDEPPVQEKEGLLQEGGAGSSAQGAGGSGGVNEFPFGENAPKKQPNVEIEIVGGRGPARVEKIPAKQSESRELLGEAKAPKTPLRAKAPQDEEPLGELVAAGSSEKQPDLFKGSVPSGTGFAAPAAPVKSAPQTTPKPQGDAWQPKVLSADKIAKLPETLGGMEYVRALEMPELVRLAREISGNLPQIVVKTGKAYGRFLGRPGSKGNIKLIARIFKDPDLAAGVIAHEIGHNIDWLPEGTLKRGNLIGRGISSTTKFMQTVFGENVDLAGSHTFDRAAVRKTAFKFFLKDKGITYGDWISNKQIRDKYKAELSAVTKKAIDKAIEDGGFLKENDLKKELQALTTWWHPFTPVKGSSYTAYRFSSKELYAEFLSVLLNAPAKAQEIAPKFFELFFEHLDKKPEVAKSFFELQDLLTDPSKVLKRREADIDEMFKKSRQTFANLLASKNAAKKNLRFLLRYHFVDRNSAILDARNKVTKTRPLNPEDDPKYLLEENSMIGGFVKSYLDDFNMIYEDLRAAGFDFDKDFGQYLFLKRVGADRAEMANPLGQTPETAARQLEALKERLGTTRFAELEKYVGRARDWFKKINNLLAEDVLNESQKKMVAENNDYAPFRVTKYLKEYASAGFMQQIGTFNDIENPGASLVFKAVAMLRLYKRNAIEKGVGDFLLQNNFGEAAEVKTYDGKVHIKEHPELDIIKWRSKGKWKAAYVDPYIADSFKYDDSGVLQSIGDVFKRVLLNDAFFRPVFITFNLGFQSANLVRDFMRFWKNTPGMTMGKALAAYKKATPAAVKRVKGDFDPTIQKMEREGALNITMNDMIMGQAKEDTEIEAILTKYGMLTPEKKVNPILRPLVALLNGIKFAGDVIETIPKVAGFNTLSNMPAQERGNYVRNYIGTPNFKRKGKLFPLYNSIFMFSNIIKEGIRSDSEVAFRNPKTRQGFWWKTIKIGFIPKILMGLAAAGAFGKAMKDNYEKQTEYDKTNYITFPIGEDERGKAIYGRIPMDETTRLLSGLFWKTMTRKEPQNLLAFTGGQVPSLSPMLEIMTTWGEFLTGGNPRDNFRNQEILTQDEAKAGGMEALEPMIRWTVNQSGLVHMDIRDRLKDETLLEKMIAFTPIVNRWIRISDYGKTEELKDVVGAQQKVESRERLDAKSEIRKAIREGKTAQQAARGLPYSEKKDFIRKYEKERAKPGADPIERALTQSTSNEQKLAVLEKLEENFSTTSEYRRALADYYRAKTISQPVLNEAVKRYNRRKHDGKK